MKCFKTSINLKEITKNCHTKLIIDLLIKLNFINFLKINKHLELGEHALYSFATIDAYHTVASKSLGF